jgi:hypothetical protein
MMKPITHAELTHAVPVDGRAHRSPQTMLFIDERDHYLREAANRFCIGMSDRAAATLLRIKLARYREGAWRRDRSEALCPARHRGSITEFCWMVLKVRDAVPSERLIRATLSRSDDG